MANQCDNVSRGDLITAKFMNDCVLDRLRDFEGRLADVEARLRELGQAKPGTTVKVPNLIGKTLVEAMEILSKNQLKLGSIYFGEATITDAQSLVVAKVKVIDQQPPANKEVAPNNAVSLYFEQPKQAAQDLIVTDLRPQEAYVGDKVDIIGDNFDIPYQKNTVMVGGKAATVLDGDEGTISIRVPSFSVLKDNLKCDVVVTAASTKHSAKSPKQLVVKVESSITGPPSIDTIVDDSGIKIIDPAGPVESHITPGELVTITGDLFAEDPGDNVVSIVVGDMEIQLPVVAASQDGTMLRVQVPSDLAHTTGVSADALKGAKIKVSRSLNSGVVSSSEVAIKATLNVTD